MVNWSLLLDFFLDCWSYLESTIQIRLRDLLTLTTWKRFVWLVMNVIHCSLWAFVCDVTSFLNLTFVDSQNITAGCGCVWGLFICIVCPLIIEATLTHISTASFRCYLQCHIIGVQLRPHSVDHNHTVVIRILIWLKSVTVRWILILGHIWRINNMLLLRCSWVLVDSIAKEPLIRTVHCSGGRMRIYKRFLHSVTQIDDSLRRLKMLSLMVMVEIRMLFPVKHLISGCRRRRISSQITLRLLVWTS